MATVEKSLLDNHNLHPWLRTKMTAAVMTRRTVRWCTEPCKSTILCLNPYEICSNVKVPDDLCLRRRMTKLRAIRCDERELPNQVREWADLLRSCPTFCHNNLLEEALLE